MFSYKISERIRRTWIENGALVLTTSDQTSNFEASPSSTEIANFYFPTPPLEEGTVTTTSPSFSMAKIVDTSSVRAPSPFSNKKFTTSSEDVGNWYHKQTHVSPNTRQMMHQETEQMAVVASRGFERAEYATTMPTMPYLIKRRYSAEVLIGSGGQWTENGWSFGNTSPPAPDVINTGTKELEQPLHPEPRLPLPNASRHYALSFPQFARPPINDDIYLELGTTTIQNDAFHYIKATDLARDGREVWMRGESLDMAFEVLRLDKRWEEHSIDFANCNTAQVFYFAYHFKDAHERTYDEYRARFHNKKWVFIICNDAFGAESNEDTSGTHWSLLAMDCVHKRVHYYDSLSMYSEGQRDLACNVSQGFFQILGEEPAVWGYSPEYNSPNQYQHNQYSKDGGACGPFVWKMAGILTDRILDYIEAGAEKYCYLDLSPDFPSQFESVFHSLNDRLEIQSGIARWKAYSESSRVLREHDQAAIQGTDVELLQEPDTSVFAEVKGPRLELEDETDLMSVDSDSNSDTILSDVDSLVENDEM